MSELWFSRNVLDFLYTENSRSIIDHNRVGSIFAKQFENIWQRIEEKNYKVVALKDFIKDIVDELYPEMSIHDKNAVWKFYKKGNLATLDEIVT